VPAFRVQHPLDPSRQALLTGAYGLKHDLIVKKNLFHDHFECVDGVNFVCPFKYLFFDNNPNILYQVKVQALGWQV
jgi:hypothetical protein